jgi:hypothetical protein
MGKRQRAEVIILQPVFLDYLGSFDEDRMAQICRYCVNNLFLDHMESVGVQCLIRRDWLEFTGYP